jgi:hypothetical protein
MARLRYPKLGHCAASCVCVSVLADYAKPQVEYANSSDSPIVNNHELVLLSKAILYVMCSGSSRVTHLKHFVDGQVGPRYFNST